MKRQIAVTGVLLAVLVGGCATLGVPGFDTPQQKAFEGASIAMFLYYTEDLPANLDRAEKVRLTVAEGDAYVAIRYPEFGSYIRLIESMAADLSKQKFKPNVEFIYYLVLRYLKDDENALHDDMQFEKLERAANQYVRDERLRITLNGLVRSVVATL